ncbi:uncharacterized protein [Panulirus ornatus]|uniref:uncharacterized protein n=1 Tax=Panulirus ornatus TaxID=150431 RepID=UPI003A8C06C5
MSKIPKLANTDTSPSTSWNVNCSEATHLNICQEDTSFHQDNTSFHQHPQGCGNQCNSSDVDLESSWKLESATSHVPGLKSFWNLEHSSSLAPGILINSWNLENPSSVPPNLPKNSRNLENASSLLPDLLRNSWNLENASSLPNLLKNSWNLENASLLLPDLLRNSWTLENASSLVPDFFKNSWNLKNTSSLPVFLINTWNPENESFLVSGLLENSSWNLENASSLLPDLLENPWNLENASSLLPDLLENPWNLENASSLLPDLLENPWNLENASSLLPDLLENPWNLENASSLLPDLLENPWNLENASSLLPEEDTRRRNLSFSPCLAQANTSSSEEPVLGCGRKTGFGLPSGVPLLATEWARIAGYSLIFLVGVVGNVLVVVTLLHHRNLRTVTNVFLLNLAVSDLLLGVFCMPFTLVGSLLQDFVFGALMCRLIPYMQAVSVSVSVWTLVAISLERFYAICQPLRSRRWQTPAHSYKVIAGVWAASFTVMTPIATLSTLMPVKGHRGRRKCREMWPSLLLERIFTILLTATLLLVPLLVMAAAYLRVIRTLWLGAKIHRTGLMAQLESSRMSDLRNCSTSDTHPSSSNSRLSARSRKIPTACSVAGKPQCVSRYPEGGKAPAMSLWQKSRQHSEDTPSNGDVETRLTSSVETHGPAFGSEDDPSSKGRRITKEKRWRKGDDVPSGFLRSSHTERSLQAKKRVIRMLFVLVAEFFICWTPLFIVNLLSLYIPGQVYAALGSFGVSLVQLLAYVSSCCNPITYCFMNANFIQSFKQAFGCPRRRCRSACSGYEGSFKSGASCHVVPSDLRRPNPRTQHSCSLFGSSTVNQPHASPSIVHHRTVAPWSKTLSSDTLPSDEDVSTSL